MKTKNKICLIEMGGTIASNTMAPTTEFYNSPEHSVIPLLNDFKLDNIEIIILNLFQKISQNITTHDLLYLANTIQSLVEDEEISGIVVTMGTNAIEDISYFIGLVVKSAKPIVFTGSHYPQNSLYFDGKLNLYNALVIAASEHAKKLGILVTFNGAVVSAREAYKSTPGVIDNFLGINMGAIGEVIGGYFKLKSIPTYKHTYATEFNLQSIKKLATTCILYAHIGMDEFIIKAAIAAKISGIISAGFGKGYQSSPITTELKKATNSGIIVVRCPRLGTSYNGVDKNYDDDIFITSRGLSPQKSSLLFSVAYLFTNDKKDLMRIFEEY